MAISAFYVQVGKIIIFSNDYEVPDYSIPSWAGTTVINNPYVGYSTATSTVLPLTTGASITTSTGYVTTTKTLIPKDTRCKIIGIVPDSVNLNYHSVKYSILSENGYNVVLELQELCKLAEIITEDNIASKVLYGQK